MLYVVEMLSGCVPALRRASAELLVKGDVLTAPLDSSNIGDFFTNEKRSYIVDWPRGDHRRYAVWFVTKERYEL